MIEDGLTALSVEIMTNRSQPVWEAASAIDLVPKKLLRTASAG